MRNFFIWASVVLVLTGCGQKDMSGRRGPARPGAESGTQREDTSPRIDQPMGVPGFQYELSPFLDMEQVQRAHRNLRDDLTRDPWNLCSERAHVWAYQMSKDLGVSSGKVMLYYTTQGFKKNPARRPWLWHTAPYIATADGNLWVMENFQGVKQPVSLRDWLKYQSNYQTGDSECVELRGTETELIRHTCGKRTAQGDCLEAPPKLIPVPRNGPKCYFRRVPQYYIYPGDIANHDYLNRPPVLGWNDRVTYNACLLPMSASSDEERNEKCAALINAEAESVEAERFSGVLPPTRFGAEARYE